MGETGTRFKYGFHLVYAVDEEQTVLRLLSVPLSNSLPYINHVLRCASINLVFLPDCKHALIDIRQIATRQKAWCG
jgi:hypothetical protein